MFLKSLSIKGFKSFADATTLEFEPGVTVVVGPNGSGKSNVVDAVAWVLGAQGPRTVRSAKMEDVIFAGTPRRPALGRAEVSLTIDNSSGLLPIGFSEVTVTRTLFRTGESEYAINRVPCRLLDVQELLSDSGVGRQQHVIVSQGNLDAILTSRSEDRRVVVEEAAGILKYRRRKERSERRLESTEASLVRLSDLLREVRRQLRPLEKQAEAARRHGDVVAELTALRRHLAGRELAVLESRIGAAARVRSELGSADAQVRSALGGLDADVLAAEAAAEATRRRGDGVDLAEAVSRAEAARARARGLAGVLTERRRGIARDLDVSMDGDVVASLEAEAADLSRGLTETEHEAAGLLPREQELLEAESVLSAEADEFAATWRTDGPRPPDPAAEVRAELGALRASVERTRSELRRLDDRSDSVEGRVARLEAEAERLAAVVADAEESHGDLLDEASACADRAAVAEGAAAAAEDRRRAADAEGHRWAARAEALAQALDETRARAGAERLADVTGMVGALAELVVVDEGWEAAFEAAAGDAMTAVVVDGIEAARRGLRVLADRSLSGAVVALPEPGGPDALSADGPVADGPVVDGPVVGGPPPGTEPVRAHVRARLPAVSALLDHLLAGAVAVDGDWGEALDLAVRRPDLVIVTRAGDRCRRGVWRVGAGGAGVTGAALEEAVAASAEAEVRAGVARQEAASARTVRDQARAARTEAQKDVEATAARQRTAAEGLARCRRERAELDGDRRSGAAARAEAVDRSEREQRRVAELEELLPALAQAAEAEAERAVAERAARSRLDERSAAVRALRRDLEVRVAGLEERRSLTERRLAEVERRLAANVAERHQAAARRERLTADATAIAALCDLVGHREAEAEELADRLRTARRVEAEAARASSEHLESLRRQRAAAERQLAEIRERAGRAETDDAEARIRLEALTDAVRRELDCEPEATRGAECPPLPPGTGATARRSELERDLRLMGPINPLALEEYQALSERHEFLGGQLEDVRAARRELGKVIRAVDGEIVEVFRAAYADVADNFEKLFATLFPGGQGRLRLTDPDSILDTGIEIEARPSGKNVRRLSLLSGGERSLTALAFLFAVFRSRPSPFYLMDEVEAALDDVNLHRFLGLLDEFRTEAQLVVVSHQKRTMEAADCLYGVTMAPGGSSLVVSQRVGATRA